MFTVTSFAFFVFIALSLLAYYVFPKRYQWLVLLICSVLFIYFSSGLSCFIFVAIDLAAVYFGSLLIERTGNTKARNAIAAVAIIIIAAVLYALKYWNNVLEWTGGLFSALRLPLACCGWIAPVGVSYFSLSAIGFILDVNWRLSAAEKNPAKLTTLVLWFPATICGPFTRYGELAGSLFARHDFDYDRFKFGAYRLLYGLFKKLVIANRIAGYTGVIFSPTYSGYTGAYIVVAALLYAFQLYSDFSGCMDIMLGVSEMFQVSLPENFRRPFFSQNLSEFWRRWHITLGQWAKDYVMYPLLKSRPFVSLGDWSKKAFGKKQGKRVPTYAAMLVLWLVIGFWHGGTLRHVFASGVLPWFIIVGGQICQPLLDKLGKLLHVDKSRFSYRLFCSLRTFFFMCMTWVFFASTSVGRGFWMLKNMLIEHNAWVLADKSLGEIGLATEDIFILFVSFVIVLLVGVLQEKGIKLRESFEKQGLVFRWVFLLAAIFAVMVFGVYGPGYNAADFIYRG